MKGNLMWWLKSLRSEGLAIWTMTLPVEFLQEFKHVGHFVNHTIRHREEPKRCYICFKVCNFSVLF